MTRNELVSLITKIVPADLVADAERSLSVPQFGPFHCEGPFMDSHLMLVLTALEEVAAGRIDERVPEQVREIMVRAVERVGLETCQLYVLLHDIDKATCMTLVLGDEKVVTTWEGWLDSFGDNTDLDAFCRHLGIAQISYYQEIDGETRTHGRVAAERLRGREDVPELVVTAIDEHEIAFQFGARGGVNIPLIERFVEGKDEDALGFIFAVNFADQRGSLGEDGRADISDFLLLAESMMAMKQLCVLRSRLETTDRLDRHKLSQALDQLRKASDAFREEDLDRTYARLVAEFTLPDVSEDAVREALAPAIADGLPNDLVEAIVAEMTATGQISKDIGKKLGKFNRLVRPALAKLG